jgi:Flp pilus assembly pilin Flp
MFEALVWARFTTQLAAVKLASGSRRAAERLRCEQRGQDLVEYGGILILVAAIIAAMFQLGIISDVKSFVSSAVNNIIGSGAASKVSQSGA